MLHQAHKGAQGGEGELARVVSQLQEARRGAAESDEELGKVKVRIKALRPTSLKHPEPWNRVIKAPKSGILEVSNTLIPGIE